MTSFSLRKDHCSLYMEDNIRKLSTSFVCTLARSTEVKRIVTPVGYFLLLNLPEVRACRQPYSSVLQTEEHKLKRCNVQNRLLFLNMCHILAAGMQAERGKTVRLCEACASTSLIHLLGGDVRWQLFTYVSSLYKLTEEQKAGTTGNKMHYYKKPHWKKIIN